MGNGKMANALARLTGRASSSGGASSASSGTSSGGATGDFALVRRATNLTDIDRIERHLPEIIGRALARGWIDNGFRDALMRDPKGLLARYSVFLPENISIEVEETSTQRQRIVVYEGLKSGERRRVMYLQLVMMAGK